MAVFQRVKKNKKNPAQKAQKKSNKANSFSSAYPNQTSEENILDLQGKIGNQAVLQLMREGTIEQPQAKPVNLNMPTKKRIQRMPDSGTALMSLPDSADQDMQQHKRAIANMVDEFHATMDGYPAAFPKSAKEASGGGAQKLLERTQAQLFGLEQAIISSLRAMKAYSQKRDKKGRHGSKHQQRIKQVEDFSKKIDRPHMIEAQLKEMHKTLLMSVMVGDENMQALTTDDIVGNVEEGAAKGGVHSLGKATMQTGQGIKTGYLKADEQLHDDAGIGLGMALEHVGQSLRAVATYEVSELLQMGIIPYTALTKGQNEDGSLTTGQFMEEAKGFAGRGRKLAEELPPDKTARMDSLLNELQDDNPSEERKSEIQKETERIVGKAQASVGVKKIDGKIYKLDNVTADIDWMSAVIQKDLSTLQLFDMIVGHADRHPENYIIETDDGSATGNMTGVKGIDNDSVWGKGASVTQMSTKTADGAGYSKTPGVPPVLDAQVALRVIQTPWKAIEAILTNYGIDLNEIATAQGRWEYVQGKVKDLIKAGQLASMEEMTEMQQFIMYVELYHAIGEDLPEDLAEKQMMVWGEQTAGFMEMENSYAGREQTGKMGSGHVRPEEYVR